LAQDHRSGLLFALGGFVLLSCGDAVVKTMAGQWAPTAIAALRYLLGAIGLSALMLWREGPQSFVIPHPKVQLLRGAGVAMATIGFFAGVFVMPLASATAVTFTSPMLTALLAAAFLGEPARKETWLASLVAFIGVLIVLRPNVAEIGWAACFPLLSAVGMSLLMIGNRKVAGSGSALAMQVLVASAATPLLLLATGLGAVSGIERFALDWPHWSVIARCALIAVSASGAHYLIFLGTTRAGAAAIAPMTYVQLLVAVTLGWAMFGNRPDLWTLLGATIIVTAGLFLWRAGRVREVATTD
jgi:drug/metabolite transporter (DMT)-like permease